MKTIFLALSLGAVLCVGQDKPGFDLTEVEKLKGEIIRLKKQHADDVCRPLYGGLGPEFQAWNSEVLTAHGNPTDVRFDEASWSYVKVPPQQTKAKEDLAARAAESVRAGDKATKELKAGSKK